MQLYIVVYHMPKHMKSLENSAIIVEPYLQELTIRLYLQVTTFGQPKRSLKSDNHQRRCRLHRIQILGRRWEYNLATHQSECINIQSRIISGEAVGFII